MTDFPNALPKEHRLYEYEIVRVLGVGGFGVTYLAFDHHLDKAAAIKEYLPNDLAVRMDGLSVQPKSSSDQKDFQWGLDRFLDEARTLARFDHPSIIRVIRFFEANDTAYIVMDYAEGKTLAAHLRDYGTLEEEELKDTLMPLLDGLEQVHQADLLHRDIKPDNIIIRADGSPVLIDFGAARQQVIGRSRSVSTIVSPGYSPIEQYSTKSKQGPWTDIYALGAVCYVALTGERPPDAADRVRNDPLEPATQKVASRASADFLMAIDHAIAVFDDQRPQNIEQWRATLEGEGPSVPDPVPGTSTQTAEKADEGDCEPPEDIPDKPPTESSVSNVRKSSAPGRKGRYLLSALILVIAIASIWVFWPEPMPDPNLIKRIQTELNRLGHDVPVDGVAGKGTTDQIRAFERATDRPESGDPSQSLFAALEATDRWPGLDSQTISVDPDSDTPEKGEIIERQVSALADVVGIQDRLLMDELRVKLELGQYQNLITHAREKWEDEGDSYALYMMGKAYLFSGAVDKGIRYLTDALNTGERRARCMLLYRERFSEDSHKQFYEDREADNAHSLSVGNEVDDCLQSFGQHLLSMSSQSDQDRFDATERLVGMAIDPVTSDDRASIRNDESFEILLSFCVAENWHFCSFLLWEEIEVPNGEAYREAMLSAARAGDAMALFNLDLLWLTKPPLLSYAEAVELQANSGIVHRSIEAAWESYHSGNATAAKDRFSRIATEAGAAGLINALAFYLELDSPGHDRAISRVRDVLRNELNWEDERIEMEVECVLDRQTKISGRLCWSDLLSG